MFDMLRGLLNCRIIIIIIIIIQENWNVLNSNPLLSTPSIGFSFSAFPLNLHLASSEH